MPSANQFPLLALQGEFLTDLEQLRIANGNRIGAMERDLGIIEGPEIATAAKLTELFVAAEKLVEKDLRNALRETPLIGWIKSTTGVGEKQAARLLAVIGHPRWRFDQETEDWVPRTIAQLWSYCGYAVVDGRAPRIGRGEQATYNPQARTRTYLIATSCIKKADSPFRHVYDAGREKYADATHPHECKRCGPAGKPAEPRSQLSAGHQHARAMRLVAKSILKDLWLAAGSTDFDGAIDAAHPNQAAPRCSEGVAVAA